MTYFSQIDGPTLLASLAHLPRTKDGTGILMLCEQWGSWSHSLLVPAVSEIEHLLGARAAYVMVNTIRPGGDSGVHVDPSPVDGEGNKVLFNRWHLPLVTNLAAKLWDATAGERHLEAGRWHGPIRYWEPHAVWNGGYEDRTHLVVSLWPSTT